MPTKFCVSSLFLVFFLWCCFFFFLVLIFFFLLPVGKSIGSTNYIASPPIIPKWLLIDPDSILCHILKNTRKRVHWLNWQQGALPSPINYRFSFFFFSNYRFSNGFCPDVLKLLFTYLHLEMKEKFIFSDSSFFWVGGYIPDRLSHKWEVGVEILNTQVELAGWQATCCVEEQSCWLSAPQQNYQGFVEALTSTLASPQADDSVIQLRRPIVFVCQSSFVGRNEYKEVNW